MPKYTFITKSNSIDINKNFENKIAYFYFQLCSFINPKLKKYVIRRFAINQNNEFIKVDYFNLSEKQFKKFIQVKKKHEYKIYPVYELSSIDYPNLGEILISKSDILSTNHNYSGFAPF